MTTILSPAEILDLPMPSGESGATTVRGFLAAVVAETWDDQKRVFGDSGWRYEAYGALYEAGLIVGTKDGDGYWATLDSGEGDRLMREAIAALSKG